MPWEVEYTDDFGQWWQQLSEGQQDAVAARVELLMEPDNLYDEHLEELRKEGLIE